MKKIMVTGALLVGLLLTNSVFAFDENNASAKEVVEKFQGDLIKVMQDGKTLGFAGRYDKLYDSISHSHDLGKIARIVVGKEWEKLSEDQQQKLVSVFSKFSVASYAHNFKDYGGETFTVDSQEETNRGGVVVHAHLSIPNDKDVKFDYMLKEQGSTWRIINVVANGVSDLALKRAEYTTILQREGFDALIAKINEKIDNYSKL
jgi:phospholipid transport system substrate-binding protein